MTVDVVVIGLNAEKTLGKCIESILNSHLPTDEIEIFYVDGGSKDQSVSIAKGYPHVNVLNLQTESPTPGAGRNMGWRAGKAPFVQFLDADTLLSPDWLEKGLAAFTEKEIGAARGYRKELYPEHSIFNWIGDQEWNGKPGFSEMFGGDVLIRRVCLEKTGGYDEILVGGEDPELSLRVRENGWKILQLDNLMTYHDLNMTTVGQYWRRAYRSGYGFAAVTTMHPGEFWRRESRRILIRGGLSVLCLILALLVNGLFLIPAILILFYPRLFRVREIEKSVSLTREEAQVYGWHASLVVIPQFFGMLRYYFGYILNRPMLNKVQ